MIKEKKDKASVFIRMREAYGEGGCKFNKARIIIYETWSIIYEKWIITNDEYK